MHRACAKQYLIFDKLQYLPFLHQYRYWQLLFRFDWNIHMLPEPFAAMIPSKSGPAVATRKSPASSDK